MSGPLHVGVVGAGAWGTALAQTAARAGHAVTLWAFEPGLAESLETTRENALYLPGVRLEPAIRATGSLAALTGADALLLVTPAQHLRPVAAALAGHGAGPVPAAICAKGLEQGTDKLLSVVLAEAFPAALPAILSGPSFAIDVARGLPTALTLAVTDPEAGRTLLRAVGLPTFRPYLSDDLVGAQIGGAVKNVLAIACGIVDGKGLGASARAALIARGFAEMSRLAVALGGRAETLAGLSGLGDLVLTASSPQSRNYSLGVKLGQGETLDAVLGGRRSVTEGVLTSGAVADLAERLGVDMPISTAVAAIVCKQMSLDAAIGGLLSRPFRSET
ncbi:MAG: NAD(P)-dependent glycerol-3-phosphate dehydrogenase [Alphaproteobacteria bacterium]|nr:NAD(P)-dependent glycerol-3-phosphate dehydrogenase [Alphaproteobacteria bacterium]